MKPKLPCLMMSGAAAMLLVQNVSTLVSGWMINSYSDIRSTFCSINCSKKAAVELYTQHNAVTLTGQIQWLKICKDFH